MNCFVKTQVFETVVLVTMYSLKNTAMQLPFTHRYSPLYVLSLLNWQREFYYELKVQFLPFVPVACTLNDWFRMKLL